MSDIENEVVTLLKEGETDVVAAFKAGATVVETALNALAPELKADLASLLTTLETDLEGGTSVDSLVTDLLNLAESKGMTFVVDLGTDVLNGLVAALLASL